MDDRSESGGPSEPGARVENAAFAPVRVGESRRWAWTPVIAAGWLLLLGGVIALGALGRVGTSPDPSTVPARAAAPPIPGPGSPVPTMSPEGRPGRLPGSGPTLTDAPNLIAVSITPSARGVDLTGTVLSKAVVWVFVSVQDASGNVESWQSVSTEDPGFRPDQQPSFTMRIDVPSRAAGQPVWIEANAYNAIGRKLGSVRRAVSYPTTGRS